MTISSRNMKGGFLGLSKKEREEKREKKEKKEALKKTDDRIWEMDGLGTFNKNGKTRGEFLGEFTNVVDGEEKTFNWVDYKPIKLPYPVIEKPIKKFGRIVPGEYKYEFNKKDFYGDDGRTLEYRAYPDQIYVGKECRRISDRLNPHAFQQCQQSLRKANYIKNSQKYYDLMGHENKQTNKEMAQTATQGLMALGEKARSKASGRLMRFASKPRYGGKKRKTRKRRKSRKKHTKKYGKRRGNKSQRRRRKRKTRKH